MHTPAPGLDAVTKADDGRPPLVLIHGAANSSGVWAVWRRALAHRDWEAHAIDLRGHGATDAGEATDLSTTSMRDYADDVESFVARLERQPVLVGWSMGGLVAMMVAASDRVAACVSLEGSPPVQRIDSSVKLREGEFGPEEYGIASQDPREQPTMPDLDLGVCPRINVLNDNRL